MEILFCDYGAESLQGHSHRGTEQEKLVLLMENSLGSWAEVSNLLPETETGLPWSRMKKKWLLVLKLRKNWYLCLYIPLLCVNPVWSTSVLWTQFRECYNSSDTWNLLIFSFLVVGLIDIFFKVCFYFVFDTKIEIHYDGFTEFCIVTTAGYSCVCMPHFPTWSFMRVTGQNMCCWTLFPQLFLKEN